MSREFPFRRVVVVADLIDNKSSDPTCRRRDLEQTDRKTLTDLCDAIRSLNLDVCHYTHPKELAEHAGAHTGDIVLSIFGGATSRSRMALVPAVCESMGLAYVGPDAYGRVICQDKEVSKTLATEAGLKVAPHRIVRRASDIAKLADFPLPYVAKPLWEGSSIGIGPESLVVERAKGAKTVASLLRWFEQPVMVEAFIPGREVSLCYIQNPFQDDIRSLAEIVWSNEPDHFDRNLYDAVHKASEIAKTIKVVTDELRPSDNESVSRLLEFVGPTGYGRVDGKLHHGEFVFLELTPDAWIGRTGAFALSFYTPGMSYEDIIARVLLSASPRRPDRSTSG